MTGHIIYEGKYGATRQYAEWLHQILGIPVSTSKEMNSDQVNNASYLVIGSSVYIGKLLIRNWLKENAQALSDKKIFLFVVSATPSTEKVKLESYLLSVPAEIRYWIEVFYLPGKIIKKNLSFFDNFMLHMGAWLQKDTAEKKKMLTDFDKIDINELNELISSVKSFEKEEKNLNPAEV
jgi:menaquinone-dependent protoporphyrinogen IX oxidase